MTDYQLIKEAHKAREKSYAPYSRFCVGAALLTANGKIYHGCNIENASYTPTNCAERTAIFKAVSEGERSFVAIAIVGGPKDGDAEKTCYPCGVCRQVMAEFCDMENFKILLADGKEKIKSYTLKELFPGGFTPESLK